MIGFLLGVMWVTWGCKSQLDSGNSGDQCVSCHVGIEDAHPVETIESNDCTICHGGDGSSKDQEQAHVAVPDDFWDIRGDGLPSAVEGYIKDMAPDQLDAIDPDYIRFINPGDIRVADQTCGKCHNYPIDLVQAVRNSVMTTNAGHYMPTRYLASMQDREPLYGSYSVEDPDFTGEEGTVASLEPLRPPHDELLEAAIEDGDVETLEQIAYDHYLSKSCNTCHAAGYPRNNAPYLYRSTGCTSCHMLYNKDGVYTGGDEAIPHNVPVYSDKHTITTAIPVQQCTTCHFQGGRIGLLFQGIREGGFPQTPENAELWNESAFGHTAGYYIIDEDSTTAEDETPPDLHYDAGMHCVDCHVGRDVHGDGRIYNTDKYQVDIRCEDCHGTSRQEIVPSADGMYYTSSGRQLPQLSTATDGSVILTGLVDGEEHAVPQPALILASGEASEEMQQAMAPDENDWCHPDSVTCDTCHNSFQQFCIGCHVSYDMRFTQEDYQTGHATTGLVRGSRDDWTLDHLLLSKGTGGRAQATNPSTQVQMAVIDFDGALQVGEWVTDEDGEATDAVLGAFPRTDVTDQSIGFSAFFQHTTSAKPRGCDTCHVQDDSAEELERVKGVYGYGTGEFMLEDPYGEPVDALKFLDDEGNSIVDWVHKGGGPVDATVRDNALGVILDELEQ